MAADSIYIVVEYMSNGSLEKYLRQHQNQIDVKVLSLGCCSDNIIIINTCVFLRRC